MVSLERPVFGAVVRYPMRQGRPDAGQRLEQPDIGGVDVDPLETLRGAGGRWRNLTSSQYVNVLFVFDVNCQVDAVLVSLL